jgi:hypothetical protein
LGGGSTKVRRVDLSAIVAQYPILPGIIRSSGLPLH